MTLGVRERLAAGNATVVKAWMLAGCLAAAWPLALSDVRAAPADLEPFFGDYVGVAKVEDLKTGHTSSRDMDIMIEPYRDGGFRIDWINVTLVNGRRDLPGVQRRVQTALFQPAEDRDFFVEVAEEDVFREREATKPLRGDPVRWASLDGPRLSVYSFVVLQEGGYELQVYDRVLTDQGIDIEFQRIVDGQVVRRITGTTVRANVQTSDD
jgi:hypothetical protein